MGSAEPVVTLELKAASIRWWAAGAPKRRKQGGIGAALMLASVGLTYFWLHLPFGGPETETRNIFLTVQYLMAACFALGFGFAFLAYDSRRVISRIIVSESRAVVYVCDAKSSRDFPWSYAFRWAMSDHVVRVVDDLHLSRREDNSVPFRIRVGGWNVRQNGGIDPVTLETLLTHARAAGLAVTETTKRDVRTTAIGRMGRVM
jgi:hypothetical protein